MSVTVVRSPSVSGDDGGWYPVWGVFNNSATSQRIGVYSASLYAAHVFFRFPTIGVPPGDTIESATLTLRNYSSPGGGPITTKVYGNKVANAVAPVSVVEAEALALTTKYTDFNLSVGSWAGYADKVITVTEIIQEIVNQPTWAINNAIMLLVKNAGSVQGYELPQSMENVDPSHQAAILTISYPTPPIISKMYIVL